MGIFKAFNSSVKMTKDEQWKEFFTSDSMDNSILVKRGFKQISERSANSNMNDNAITHGSLIALADGLAAIVVSGGKIKCVIDEPGEHVYNDPDYKGLASNFFHGVYEKFTFGGGVQPVYDRIYFFNTKEIMGNTFSLQSSIPLNIKRETTGLDMEVGIKISGMYSFRIVDPEKFYKLISGNVSQYYYSKQFSVFLNTHLLTAINKAVSILSNLKPNPSQIPAAAKSMADYVLRTVNTSYCLEHGVAIVSLAFDTFQLSDMTVISQLDAYATLKDPAMAAAVLTGSYAEALKNITR